MNGFERRKQLKMDQIRQAALFLFSKYGIQKVNIQDIAKKANVSQVTIYNYFGSKDELIFDVIKRYMENQLNDFIEIKNSPLSFKEKTTKLIELKMSNTNEINPEFIEAILSNNQQISDYIEHFMAETMMPLLFEFLEEGRDSGHISKNISTETILFIMNMLTDSIRKNSTFFLSEAHRTKLTREIIHFFFYGLLG